MWFPKARLMVLSFLAACSLLVIPMTPAPGAAAVGPPCNANGVLCGWGDNSSGSLGVDGIANTFNSRPVAIEGLTEVIAVAGGALFSASEAFTLALRRDGTVWAWGQGGYGQLGTGNAVSSRVPVPVNLTNVMAIAAGGLTSYALRTDGTVWAWGSGSAGQLGNRLQCTTSSVPVQVQGLTGVKAIAASGVTAYALRSDGHVVAWGSNYRGAIGNGGTSPFRDSYPDCPFGDEHDVLSPVAVIGLSDAVAIAGGFSSGYALKNDGTVWAWGSGGLGALGNGDTSEADALIPVQVKGLSQIQSIASYSSGKTVYALGSGGNVWSWGYGGQGNLGNGAPFSVQPYTFSAEPVRVVNLSGITSIGATTGNGYARKNDGTVWAWGAAYAGALGNGDPNATDTSTPVQVTNVGGATAVFGGLANGFVIGEGGGATLPPPPVTLGRYVVLGDSIPYGHGLANPTKDVQGGLPPNQPPSSKAYPQLIADGLPGLRPLSYRLTSCDLVGTNGKYYDHLAVSGAPSIVNTWTGKDDNCPYPRRQAVPLHKAVFQDELNAANLKADPPALVTLQVGADDINFVGCLKSLLSVLAQAGAVNCVVRNGKSYELTRRANEQLESLKTGLAATIATIRRDAPRAKIVVLDYYQIVPEANAPLSGHTRICQDLRFSKPGGNFRREIRAKTDFVQQQLNDTIKSVAAQNPGVVMVDIQSLFNGHELCTVDRWVFDGIWSGAHPNEMGHQKIADAVLRSIKGL